MSKSKGGAANAPVVVQEASQKGLRGFDDKAVTDAIVKAFEQATIAGVATDAKEAAAFVLCQSGTALRHDQHNALLSDDAFQQGWRYSTRGILPRLFTAGVTWVEQTTREMSDGTVKVGYKLTQYGRNISSAACRSGLFLTVNETDEAGSYRGVLDAIKVKADAAIWEELTDEQKECREQAELFSAGVKVLRGLLKQAECSESWKMSVESIAEQIEMNTPIKVDEIDPKAAKKVANG